MTGFFSIYSFPVGFLPRIILSKVACVQQHSYDKARMPIFFSNSFRMLVLHYGAILHISCGIVFGPMASRIRH